jgi:hypothetical protein
MIAARPARIGNLRRIILTGLALTLTVFSTTAAVAAPAAAATAAGSSCQHAVGPFHVHGTLVFGAHGKIYIPYGITVPGLANYPNWGATMAADHQKILATARSWCSNTVRLQVSQDNLLGTTGTGFSKAYLNAIKTEVGWAEGQHLVVVLNDQTETAQASGIDFQKGPTPGTETFWKDLKPAFGGDKQVIFDLFNEPRTFVTGMSQQQEWSLWHDGGTFEGRAYIGTQKLAADLRAAGVRNLFWVEGPDFASTFAGMQAQGAVLTTPDVVYDFHHPQPDPKNGRHDESSWHDDFAWLVITNVGPVVDGEWTNYQPFGTAANSECWKDAVKQIPAFLKYLAGFSIGMTAYQLAKGLLVKSNTNLASPTTISAATWSCTHTTNPTNQGAGQLIRNWYRTENG